MNRGYRRYKNPRVNPEGPVDLGLSDLVSEPVAGSDETPGKESATSREPARRNDSADEFDSLVRDAKWVELTGYCENVLSDTTASGDIKTKAKILWVAGQLKSGSVPPEILVAPADTATRLLIEAGSDPAWAEKNKALMEAGRKMLTDFMASLDRGDHRKIESGISERIKDIDFALREAEARREKQREEELRKEASGNEASTQPDPSEKVLNELGMLEGVASGTRTHRLSPRLLSVLFLVPLAAALLFATYGLLSRSGEDTDNFSRVEIPIYEKEHRPPVSQIQPEVSLISSVSHIDAIMYDVKSRSPASPEVQTGGPVQSAGSGATEKSGTGQAPAARVIVNTSEPVEPDEVRLATTTKREKLNDLNEEENVVEDSRPVFGDQIPRNRESENDFSKPRMYEVVAATSVMSEASIRSQVLADLKPGDKIMVEGKKGTWLKIRSRSSGETGFVLSQDVMPEKRW